MVVRIGAHWRRHAVRSRRMCGAWRAACGTASGPSCTRATGNQGVACALIQSRASLVVTVVGATGLGGAHAVHGARPARVVGDAALEVADIRRKAHQIRVVGATIQRPLEVPLAHRAHRVGRVSLCERRRERALAGRQGVAREAYGGAEPVPTRHDGGARGRARGHGPRVVERHAAGARGRQSEARGPGRPTLRSRRWSRPPCRRQNHPEEDVQRESVGPRRPRRHRRCRPGRRRSRRRAWRRAATPRHARPRRPRRAGQWERGASSWSWWRSRSAGPGVRDDARVGAARAGERWAPARSAQASKRPRRTLRRRGGQGAEGVMGSFRPTVAARVDGSSIRGSRGARQDHRERRFVGGGLNQERRGHEVGQPAGRPGDRRARRRPRRSG